LVAAVAAANFEAPSFKSDAEALRPIETLTLYDGGRAQDFSRTLAAAEGNNLARWLTLLPANYLTPTEYLGYVTPLAKREGWKLEFLDEKKLAKIGAGAFLAVAQGSESRDAGILHLTYKPPKLPRDARSVALVGKGICYDTGGVNLKTAKSMFGMHGDMQGSAVALGTLLALARLQLPIRVDVWLALARNQIGPRAYTQNDVVQSFLPHVTIEIVHTDAEGRMVLADTLALAVSGGPEFLIDYATLTGACVTALGSRYSGAFCNRPELMLPVIDAGDKSGERVWPFPVDADYDEELDSSIADVKQCTVENQADHILAARFLSRFVPPSVPWVHVDLAASEHKGGLAHVSTDVTGFGVRFSLELLLGHWLPAA
jgi:leucyl aminopeptidase